MNDQQILEKPGMSGNEKRDGASAPVSAGPPKAAPAKFAAAWAKGKWVLMIAAVVVIGGLAYAGWEQFQPPKLPPGFASSNGRIEATEIDVATKLPGASLTNWSTKAIF